MILKSKVLAKFPLKSPENYNYLMISGEWKLINLLKITSFDQQNLATVNLSF